MVKTNSINRLRQVLTSDKHVNLPLYNKLITNSICEMLSHFMYIEPEKVFSNIEINENGEYVYRLKVITKRIKSFGTLNNN